MPFKKPSTPPKTKQLEQQSSNKNSNNQQSSGNAIDQKTGLQGQQPQSGQGGQNQQPQANGATNSAQAAAGAGALLARVGALGAAGSELGPGDLILIGGAVIYLAAKNPDLVKKVVSQLSVAVEHIGKLNTSPDKDPRGTWRDHAKNAINRARHWADRMSPGKSQDLMNRLINAVDKAVPAE